MAWDLTIGGVSKKTKVDADRGVAIRLEPNERSSMTFSLAPGTYAPARFDAVIAYAQDGTTPIFGGVILDITQERLTAHATKFRNEITCTDWWFYLDKSPVTVSFDTDQTLEAVLDEIISQVPAAHGITVHASQVTGPTLAAYTLSGTATEVIKDALRRAGGWMARMYATKALRAFEPGTEAAPYDITTATPNCSKLAKKTADRTPSNRVELVCGPSGVGADPITHEWTADGIATTFALDGLNVPASSVWPGSALVDAVTYPIWPPGEAPGGNGIEWDYETDGGTLSFLGTATSLVGGTEPIVLTYYPQYPFTVSATSGATPVLSERRADTTITEYARGVETVEALLDALNQDPVEVAVVSKLHGWFPGQAVLINVANPTVNTTCTIGPVTIALNSDEDWEYTFEAAETEIFQGSDLDLAREVVSRMAGGASGSGGGIVTVTSTGGGIAGSGTAGKIPKWLGSEVLTDSIITESGGAITVAGAATITGGLTIGTGQNLALVAGDVSFNSDAGYGLKSANGTRQLTVTNAGVDVTALTIASAYVYRAGGTDVPVTDGGTGASNASDARTNLGLVIGTHVQAYDADLTTWAGVTPGTGVTTALAVNVGSAGAFVTFNGALGTPSSGTLTNAAGLPWAGVLKTGSSLADLATRSAADLSSGVLADARVQQSNVTQHQAALSIAETQIPDGAIFARVAANETISGAWAFTDDIFLTATKKLYLDTGSNTYVVESASDTISIVTGGTVSAVLTAGAAAFNGTGAFGGNLGITSGEGAAIRFTMTADEGDNASDVFWIEKADGGAATFAQNNGAALTTYDTSGGWQLPGTLLVAGTLTGVAGVWTGLQTVTVASEQQRLRYDASNYLSTTVSSVGVVAFDAVGSAPAFTFGDTIGHPSYASQTTNWRVTAAGSADFRYLYVDEMHAKSFIADLEQALAGGQIIAKSVAVLAANFTAPAAGGTTTLVVEDLPGAADMEVFVDGDYVVVRSFTRSGGGLVIGDCVGVVTDCDMSASGTQSWTFTRASGGNAGAMTEATVVEAGGLAIDYGVSGNGYYEVNAVDGAYGANSPYAQVVTFSGAPVAANRTVRARFGKLDGITSETDEYGLIAGTYGATDGQYFRASNEAFELHGIDISMWDGATEVFKVRRNAGDPYLSLGATPPSAYGANAGVFLGWSGTVAQMSLYADANNYLQYDGAVLTWKAANTTLDGSGNLTATSATLTGAITANTGYIGGTGGWVVSTGLISATNAKIGSNGTTGYIGFGATPPTTYGANVGAFLGYDTTAKLSLYADANNYLQWDGSKLLVKAANVTIDSSGNLTASSATLSGTITATAGAIGGFDIGADYIRDAANSFGLASTVSGSDDVRFWAGATFANRATAPARITEGGIATFTDAVLAGTITFDSGTGVPFYDVTLDASLANGLTISREVRAPGFISSGTVLLTGSNVVQVTTGAYQIQGIGASMINAISYSGVSSTNHVVIGGSTTRAIIESRLRIGSTSTPTVPLDVTGNAAISGTLDVTGTGGNVALKTAANTFVSGQIIQASAGAASRMSWYADAGTNASDVFWIEKADGGNTTFAQNNGAALTTYDTSGNWTYAGSLYTNSAGANTIGASGTPFGELWVNQIVVGTPTGGAKGAGTINAVAVYDDNTLLSDWIFDLYYDGRTTAAHADRLYSLTDTRAVTQSEHRLPWMPSAESFDADRSLGRLTTRLWQGQEQQQLYIFELSTKVAELEAEVARLTREAR